jgi:hypothetical protein
VVIPQEPRSDGSLVHVVRFGDTLSGILIAYANFGITNELLIERNNWRFLPQFIFPDEQIIILPPGSIDPATGQLLANPQPPTSTPDPAQVEAPVDPIQPDVVQQLLPTTTGQPRRLTGAEIEALPIIEAMDVFLPLITAQEVEAQRQPDEALATSEPALAELPTATPILPSSPTSAAADFAPIATEEASEGDSSAPVATPTGEASQVANSEINAALAGAERDNRRFPGLAGPTTPLATAAQADDAGSPTAIQAATEVASAPSPTATQAVTEIASTPSPTATQAATEAASAPSLTPTATIISPTQVIAPTLVLTGQLCLGFYDDANQNGLRDASEEALQGGSFHINDEEALAQQSSEPLCWDDLASGQVQVLAIPPDGFGATTTLNVLAQVTAGRSLTIEFGAAQGVSAAAPEVAMANETLTPPIPSALQPVSMTAEREESRGLLDYASYIVLALAVFTFGLGIAIAALWRMLR